MRLTDHIKLTIKRYVNTQRNHIQNDEGLGSDERVNFAATFFFALHWTKQEQEYAIICCLK
jgi:hypothetical protein